MAKIPKSEFDQKKEILQMQEKMNIESHERRMVELKFIRESELIQHEHECERQRIKSAEIRKTQERKEQARNFRY